ncbi:MAG: hypothetical protein GKC10_01620 [Methanosarcinales archaeon]|nr:hypothetical protein [Methanosarcinales archaeon]
MLLAQAAWGQADDSEMANPGTTVPGTTLPGTATTTSTTASGQEGGSTTTATSSGGKMPPTTAPGGEIKDYDIMLNYDGQSCRVSLCNHLTDELSVFLDGTMVGIMAPVKLQENGDILVPTWTEFEVDHLPEEVVISDGRTAWNRDLRTYAPLAYERGYGVIDRYLEQTKLGSKDGQEARYFAELGMKVKIEHPLQMQADEQGSLVVELITSDARVATTPDLENNIGPGEIKIASVESLKQEGDVGLWIDPVKISDEGWMKPYNDYSEYGDLFDVDQLQSIVLETELQMLSLFDFISFLNTANDVLDWKPEVLKNEDREKIFICGNFPQDDMFYDINDCDCWTYSWTYNFFSTFVNSANRVKLDFPFKFESPGSHKVAIYLSGNFGGKERLFSLERAFTIDCQGAGTAQDGAGQAGSVSAGSGSDSGSSSGGSASAGSGAGAALQSGSINLDPRTLEYISQRKVEKEMELFIESIDYYFQFLGFLSSLMGQQIDVPRDFTYQVEQTRFCSTREQAQSFMAGQGLPASCSEDALEVIDLLGLQGLGFSVVVLSYSFADSSGQQSDRVPIVCNELGDPYWESWQYYNQVIDELVSSAGEQGFMEGLA